MELFLFFALVVAVGVIVSGWGVLSGELKMAGIGALITVVGIGLVFTTIFVEIRDALSRIA